MRLLQYAHNQKYPDARKMILDALGIEEGKIPRIRAVYIGDEGPIIHTRTGGGNREQYDTKESFIEGEYGIDHSIKEYTDALSNYESDYWRWHADLSEYQDAWQVPYELTYVFPETDDEWDVREKDIKQIIKELEEQKKEVLATGAYTNEYLRNQYYIRDEDDDFDCTYADFFYRWPEGLKEQLQEAGYLE